MYNKQLLHFGALATAVVLPMGVLTSCEEDLSKDAHYEAPSFLAGNALEVLQKDFEGHSFKTFLRGLELIGYNDVVDSQILTVLAPTDEAFAAFLKQKGYASIDEMYAADATYTVQTLTYHLLYYAMDWEKMTNFRPLEGDGATEMEKNVRAGMYNRFRTRCSLPETTEFNNNPDVNADVQVVHSDRYLTVFSEKMFHTLGIDAASNYNYFFLQTAWNPKHLSNGFNVMNAAVLDTAAVVTDNGYLYHIDHVIEPVGTIYEEMNQRDNYQLIKELFEPYSEYRENEDETNNRGYLVYNHGFSGLPDIALEWPVSDYRAFATNSLVSWNLFVPTDQAMHTMFSTFWGEGSGINSVESLDPLIKKILIQECVGYIAFDGERQMTYMCYPDYIRQGNAVSYFGTEISTDPATFDCNIVCNNGVIYGSNKMDVPGVFQSVAGPAFKDVKYLPYLYAMDGADLLLSHASKQATFISLVPDADQFAKNTPAIRLFLNKLLTPAQYELQQWSDVDADYKKMEKTAMINLVNMHTSTDAAELKTTGTQVVESGESFNYWYVNDGKITTNALFNMQLNPTFHEEIWYPFHEIKRNANGDAWSNGKAYAYEYPGVYMPASGTRLETELSQNIDRNYPYSCFVQLLQKAGLANSSHFSGMLTLDLFNPRFFVVVPTNEAIKNHLNEIPGASALKINESTYAITGTLSSSNKNLLANYLLSYFVTADRNTFNSYPYVGSNCKGVFETSGTYGLNIVDNGTSLSASFVSQRGSQPEGTAQPLVGTYNYLPFAFSDGAFQLIDTILK